VGHGFQLIGRQPLEVARPSSLDIPTRTASGFSLACHPDKDLKSKSCINATRFKQHSTTRKLMFESLPTQVPRKASFTSFVFFSKSKHAEASFLSGQFKAPPPNDSFFQEMDGFDTK